LSHGRLHALQMGADPTFLLLYTGLGLSQSVTNAFRVARILECLAGAIKECVFPWC
jgi:hypothetical protein